MVKVLIIAYIKQHPVMFTVTRNLLKPKYCPSFDTVCIFLAFSYLCKSDLKLKHHRCSRVNIVLVVALKLL